VSLTFTRATRAQVPLKLGISGPSGSGKTTAALKLSRGLIGPDAPLAFLDTENGSASLYADITPFDVINMNPPYLVQKFLDGITAAVEAGYKALVIDSASHEWIQILQDKEALDARGGNQWTNWATFTKKHEDFLAAIRHAPIHLILCLRSKEKHEMNDQKKIVKMGMGNQMRDGFSYELTTVFDVAMDHNAVADKDRTGLFGGRMWPITEATGQELSKWLSGGGVMAPNTGESFKPEPATSPTTTERIAAAGKAADAMEAARMTPNPETHPKEYQAAAGELFTGLQAEALANKPEPSAATSDFVDEVAAKWLSPEACAEILIAAQKAKVSTDLLAQYLHKKGWMPDVKNWTRIESAALKPIMLHLSEAKLTAFKSHLNSHFSGAAA
jgi:DNA polymerase III delta prime subunit